METSTYRTSPEVTASRLNAPDQSMEEAVTSDYEEGAAAGEAAGGVGQHPVGEDVCTEIGIDGRYMRIDDEGNPAIPAEGDDITADPPETIPDTPDLPPEAPIVDLSSSPSTQGENSSEKYRCSVCGNCFSDPVTLLRHGKVHREKMRFFCPLCGRGCISKSDLIKHERVHTGEKPYSCSLCGKCYSQKSHLYTHERVHTGEKPFSCSQCLRRFSFKSQLLRHMRDHTGADPLSVRRRPERPLRKKLVKLQSVPVEEKTYSCTLCGKCFPLKSQLISHILNDTGDGPDSCSNRRKTVGLSLKQRQMKPRKLYSEENTYACEECGRCFTLKSQLIKHIREHAAEASDSGLDRGGGSAVSDVIVKVEKEPSEEIPFSCAECGKCFSLKTQLIRHVREHAAEDLDSGAEHEGGLSIVETPVKVERDSSEENPYSCAECGKCFSLKSQLIKHVWEHAGGGSDSGAEHAEAMSVGRMMLKAEMGQSVEKLYSCEECGECFTLKTQVIKHMRDHARGSANPHNSQKKVWTVNGKVFRPEKGPGEKPYTCDECGKGFSGVPDLARHKRMHIRGKPFHCSFCGKGCASKSDLIKHERVHTGEKPYPCSYCGQCFSQTSHLNQHERIHTGVKPYGCVQCGKCYAFKSQLTKHEQVHAEGKIYSCSKCTKIFSVEEERNQHERVHTEEKPYSCSVCGKSFHWKAAFIRHERAHTGKLPFTCAECGRGCASRYDLIKHERVHTREKPYVCSDCGKCYSQKSHLNLHVKVHTA